MHLLVHKLVLALERRRNRQPTTTTAGINATTTATSNGSGQVDTKHNRSQLDTSTGERNLQALIGAGSVLFYVNLAKLAIGSQIRSAATIGLVLVVGRDGGLIVSIGRRSIIRPAARACCSSGITLAPTVVAGSLSPPASLSDSRPSSDPGEGWRQRSVLRTKRSVREPPDGQR